VRPLSVCFLVLDHHSLLLDCILVAALGSSLEEGWSTEPDGTAVWSPAGCGGNISYIVQILVVVAFFSCGGSLDSFWGDG